MKARKYILNSIYSEDEFAHVSGESAGEIEGEIEGERRDEKSKDLSQRAKSGRKTSQRLSVQGFGSFCQKRKWDRLFDSNR